MSAVAAIVHPQGTVLLSDGITFKHPNGVTSKCSECEIVHTDFPKIFKINDSVGVTWVGNALPEVQERFKEGCKDKGLKEPKEIAEYLTEVLQAVHKGERYWQSRRNPRERKYIHYRL